LMMSDPAPMRATDLASALNVSNAALSGRVGKLARLGLLTCTESPTDRRMKMLQHTGKGAEKVQLIGRDLEEAGRFVHHYRQLPQADREALERIIGQLHTMLDRDFLPVSRGLG
jgi:DNA-binding MarR family transcriptional regulator